MPKTVKELIRDRYEKLLDRVKDIADRLRLIEAGQDEELDQMQMIAERLGRILEILEAGPQPDANFLWPANVAKLMQELAFFAETSPEADSLAFKQQTPNMQLAANAFQDYLVAKFADVELVNSQQERHGYENPDRTKHADTLVILVNPADPSEDIIVDFCRASKEPGTLYGKLQFLIVGETPW